ncbi:TonB-dependent receptor [Novosphingobium sp.]|uniref:TonB-dependent receptor n=1 Tax=Novosphingobium sp. TaxID=1874826 RepID=UPI00334100F5
MRLAVVMLIALVMAPPALAQAVGSQEIVVTASRREAKDYDDHIPAIGLRRVADFAVQEVTVAGDTRDPDKRHDEIYQMIRGAIELAAKRGGIELATGEMVVEPLTLANYRNLTLQTDGRPDSNRTSFLVKTRLSGGTDAKAALDRISAYIKAVPAVGRAELKPAGELTLSVVGPDQYRGKIVDLVADDARATAARLGPDYAVEAKGLDRPVEWSRASLTDVFLYVPYAYTVVPKH